MSTQPIDNAATRRMPPPLQPKEGSELIAIRDLKVHFNLGGGTFLDKLVGGSPVRRVVKAVDGVSLDIYPGETLGLVGESGCGKSTLGRALLRLTEPTGGQVFYKGKDLSTLSKSAMREQRKYLQMIFQDPYASLNPRMTVGQIIGEPIETFRLARGSAADRRVQELMETVGLSSVTRTSFRAGSVSASASHALLQLTLTSSSRTNPSPLWTFPFRRRS